MDSREPTNRKLFCVNQQHVSIHQPTQHIQNSNVPSLGLEQSMRSCAPTPRGVCSNKSLVKNLIKKIAKFASSEMMVASA